MPSASHSSSTLQSALDTEHAHPFRRLMSFPVLCMFLLISVIFGFSVRNIAEPDVWWHLRNAQNLLQQHSFCRFDTYTFTAAGSPWISDQWLSEIPFLLAFRVGGLRGLLVLYFAILVAIFVGVYYRACRAGDCKDATLVTFVAICLGAVSIGPRTLLFGWLCMTGLLLVLDHFKRSGRGAWLLPPLFVLWINLHGSWVFGIIVLLLFIGSGLKEGEWGWVAGHEWSPEQFKNLLLATATSFVGLFINPFGYKLVFYPFDLFLRHKGVMQSLQEWQPVDFSTGSGKLTLILLFSLFAAALLSSRPWSLDEVVLSGFALWAGLSHVRFLFFSGMVITPILSGHIKLFPPYKPEIDKPWLNGVIVGGLLLGMIISFPSQAKLEEDVNTHFPTAALAFLQQRPFMQRVFNPDWWGGYIEWSSPQLKTFIDGRVDIFVYQGIFADYLRTVNLTDPLGVLDKYSIDCALVEPSTPLAYLLAHSPAWRLTYSDRVAEIFERTSGPAGNSRSALQTN